MSCTIVDQDIATPMATIHPEIIQSHILTRLDGSTLASTSCATSQLFTLCSHNVLWQNICNATWPSTTDPRVVKAISNFPSGHKSFYSDAFPSIRLSDIVDHYKVESKQPLVSETREFISAVDVYDDGKLVYSKVFVTETLSCWFATSPFQIDMLSDKETIATSLKFDDEISRVSERIGVSWILIDPLKGRAFSVASRMPVDARRHWMTEDVMLRYATVVAHGGDHVQCAVVVTCGGKEGGGLSVKEVSMRVEDMEGKVQMGVDSLAILNEAMEGERRKSDGELDKSVYEKFLKVRVEKKEKEQRRERNLDVLCIATGVSIFVASWVMFFSGGC